MIETVRRALRWRWPWMVLVLVPVAVVGIWWVEAQPTRAEAVSVVGVTPASVEYANPDLVQLTVNRYAVLLASPTGLQGVSDDTGIDVDELEQAVSVESSLDSANLRIVVDAATEERAEEIADAVAAHARVLGADDDATDVSVLSPAVVQAPAAHRLQARARGRAPAHRPRGRPGRRLRRGAGPPRIRTGGDAEAATGAMVVAGMRRFPSPACCGATSSATTRCCAPRAPCARPAGQRAQRAERPDLRARQRARRRRHHHLLPARPLGQRRRRGRAAHRRRPRGHRPEQAPAAPPGRRPRRRARRSRRPGGRHRPRGPRARRRHAASSAPTPSPSAASARCSRRPPAPGSA